MRAKYLLNAWIVVACGMILAEFMQSQAMIYLCKPLIMPLLGIYAVQNLKENRGTGRLVLAGVTFSWLGDVFLMLPASVQDFFIPGLAAFLLAHLCYIIIFSRDVQLRKFWRWWSIGMLALVVAYCQWFLRLLWPFLGALKIPVLVYALVISLMLLMAVMRSRKIHLQSYVPVVVGAGLFIVSDSVLAYNKFVELRALSGPIIMFTYMLAQFMIVVGIVRRYLPA